MQPSPKSKAQSASADEAAALREILRATIERDGPQTFAWFMEQALYHPAHGYYSSGRAQIGRRGDYFTNVSVGPLFGRLLLALFVEMWETLDRPDAFTMVEQGAHEGDFARDVLSAAQLKEPEFFRALRYEIVEPFPILRARQMEALRPYAEKISWHESLEALPPYRGVHFSNELLDAMPVHLLRWDGARWQERFVALEGDEFVFVDGKLSDAQLPAGLPELPYESYIAEVNLGARDWLRTLAAKLERGFVVICDYGFAREEFCGPHRPLGTLQSYAQHRALGSPFLAPGASDLTAHVNWSQVREWAEEFGLTSNGFADQHHFLTGLLAGPVATEIEGSADAKTRRALQTLLHPEMLGRKFQFLLLSRAVPSAPPLSGWRFAQKLP